MSREEDLMKVIDAMARKNSSLSDHSTVSAAHYFGMLNQDVPPWAVGEILHVAEGAVMLADECVFCEGKDRS